MKAGRVGGDGGTDAVSPNAIDCQMLSSERYHAFVENIDEGVYEVDLDGNYLYFNNALCRIFGYPREEIQFRNYAHFMDKENARKAFEAFNRIYQTGKGFSDLIWEIRTKAGHTRVIELSAGLITNHRGEKVGFRGIARDITEKHEARLSLQKSERRFRTLLDFAPYPVVVFTVNGLVTYLNPSFTETFGWTLEELKGKAIPYVPAGLEEETTENIRRLFKEKVIFRHETRRLTKDGRVLDVSMRAAVFSENDGEPSGELVILRDITRENRIKRNNEALLRITMAMPEYPHLEDLLDYVSSEIKSLLNVEGALVILLDEEKNELYFKAASHDDLAAERRVKEIRFSADRGVSGEVIRTGRSVIIPDTSKDPNFYPVVDVQAGFKTRNMLDVPLRSRERIIGVLCAMNKKTGAFDQTDVELLNMISGSVALTIENTRFSEEVREAYREVSSLNRAKDRMINHLSHELKTPLSVLRASLNILGKRLSEEGGDAFRNTIERAQRNLDRILELQYQAEDIMEQKDYAAHRLMSLLLEECKDALAALAAEEAGEGDAVERIRKRIEELFGPSEDPPEDIRIDEFVPEILREIRPLFSHREIELVSHIETTPRIRIPAGALRKVVIGLIRNAVENTPDEGRMEVTVQRRGTGAEFLVRDYGVGITSESQPRIFEGFFSTRDTMTYSSKRPYDFNAGGKGIDLFRMRVFSERHHFRLHFASARCAHIPRDQDICPGRISDCPYCREKGDCHKSGGSTFRVYFPPAPADESHMHTGMP